ncbi:DUF1573 domain-containing protein [Candidatus Omnitrophota bacterium]
MMGKKLFFSSLLLSLALSVTACHSQEKPPEPQEVKASNSWDFGSVGEGDILSHDFALKNNSSNKLRIIDLRNSCECVSSSLKKDVLGPQESTVLEVKIDTTGYPGRFSQFVLLFTDDPDNEIIKFTVTAGIR